MVRKVINVLFVVTGKVEGIAKKRKSPVESLSSDGNR